MKQKSDKDINFLYDFFSEQVERAIEIGVDKLYYAFATPLPKSRFIHTTKYRFTFLLSGSRSYIFADKNEIIQRKTIPGEYIFCLPYGWTTPLRGESFEMMSVIFDTSYTRFVFKNSHDNQLAFSPSDHILIVNKPPGNAINHTLKALHATFSQMTFKENTFLINYLLTSCLRILENKEQISTSTSEQHLSSIKSYMEDHLELNISLNMIGKKFSLNPNYVSQLFMRGPGSSFTEFLKHLRLEKAEYLLENTDLTINEIAEQCGFNQTSYFIKTFKNEYKLTPKSYRIKNFER